MAKKNKQKEPAKITTVTSPKVIGEKENYWFDNQKIVFGLLGIIVFISYFGAFNNDFVGWDDNSYVYENQDVLNQNWGKLFSSIYEANFHPLTMVSLAVNAAISQKPTIFILTNVLIHALNAMLVFVFIKKLTSGKNLVGFFTALIFAIHPMHVESVAWVSERKDVLYTFFFLLSAIYYLKIKENNIPKYLIISLFMFLLSCLSKGMAVTLPLVLVLIDYWQNEEIKIKDFVTKWHYFTIALLFGLIAVDAQSGGNFHGLIPRISEGSAINQVWSFPEKLLFAGYGFFMYILKFFVPYGLHHFYAYPYVNEAKSAAFYILPILSVSILVITLFSYKRNKSLFFGLIFFIITIILVLQILAVGNATMAERYSYIPYIGLAFGLFYWLDQKFSLKKILAPLGIISMVFMVLTGFQVETWKNTTALLENSYPHHPDDSYLASSLATNYAKIGKMEEAIKICAGPISRGAANYKFYEITGNSFYLGNNPKMAIKYYNDGLQFTKDSLSKNIMYRNLGVAYQKIDQNEAIKNFKIAYQFKPEIDLLKLIGGSYIAVGKYKEALENLNTVYVKGFANDSTFTDMAVAKFELGDRIGAINDLKTALKVNPGNEIAKNNLKLLGIN